VARPRTLAALAAIATLGLAGCGTTAEYERVEYPPPAPVAPLPEEPETLDEFADTDPSALTDFKPALDPHGTWVEDPTYGTVWVPSPDVVGGDFAPYVTAGHWAIDDRDQYVWVSDYDPTFGWVVFHYGRWVWIEDRGWAWIPGRRYAPAWVVWRTGDPGYEYVGWGPAPPYYYWHGGAVVWLSYYPPAPFVFCHTTYIFHDHVHTHLVARGHVAAVAASTHSYANGTGKHVLATPQPGPTARSGHIPASAWPTTHATSSPGQAKWSTPSGMHRASSVPNPSATRAMPSSHGFDGSRSLGTSHTPTYRAPPTYSPGHSPSAPGHAPTYTPRAPTHTSPSYTPRPSAPSGGHSPSYTPRPSAPSGGHTPSAAPAPHAPSRAAPTSKPSTRSSGGGKRRLASPEFSPRDPPCRFARFPRFAPSLPGSSPLRSCSSAAAGSTTSHASAWSW